MRNVPDDWDSYYNKCGRCGGRYHASEGGCYCLDDHDPCAGSPVADECYVHADNQIKIGDKVYCDEHAECVACGKNHRDAEWIKSFEGDPYCNECWDDDDGV